MKDCELLHQNQQPDDNNQIKDYCVPHGKPPRLHISSVTQTISNQIIFATFF